MVAKLRRTNKMPGGPAVEIQIVPAYVRFAADSTMLLNTTIADTNKLTMSMSVRVPTVSETLDIMTADLQSAGQELMIVGVAGLEGAYMVLGVLGGSVQVVGSGSHFGNNDWCETVGGVDNGSGQATINFDNAHSNPYPVIAAPASVTVDITGGTPYDELVLYYTVASNGDYIGPSSTSVELYDSGDILLWSKDATPYTFSETPDQVGQILTASRREFLGIVTGADGTAYFVLHELSAPTGGTYVVEVLTDGLVLHRTDGVDYPNHCYQTHSIVVYDRAGAEVATFPWGEDFMGGAHVVALGVPGEFGWERDDQVFSRVMGAFPLNGG